MTKLGTDVFSESTDVNSLLANIEPRVSVNEEDIETLESRQDRLNPDTLAIWQADLSAKAGDTVTTKERSAGGGGGFTGDVVAGTGTANGLEILAHNTLSLSLEIRLDGFATLEQLGVVDQSGFQAALNLSNSTGVELSGKAAFTLTARINLPARFKLKSNFLDIVITASASYFSGSEGFMIFGDSATNIADSYIEGVHCIGGLADVTEDGIDRHGIRIDGCVNTSIRYCKAETLERGLLIRNGATGGEIAFNEALNCYNQGIGYIGTSGSPIRGVKLHHNFAQTVGFTTQAKMSGIRTEEVFDSEIFSNRARKCDIGLRWENTSDCEMHSNYGWENDKCGGELYNVSQRNHVHGNHFWDNNVSNQNDTSLAPDNKGNAGTKLSGLNIENDSNNNTITGNFCYQTIGGIGRQKYGIGINIRNLIGGGAADAYNIVTNNQCFNNELRGIEDRGIANNVNNNTDNSHFVDIVRNV